MSDFMFRNQKEAEDKYFDLVSVYMSIMINHQAMTAYFQGVANAMAEILSKKMNATKEIPEFEVEFYFFVTQMVEARSREVLKMATSGMKKRVPIPNINQEKLAEFIMGICDKAYKTFLSREDKDGRKKSMSDLMSAIDSNMDKMGLDSEAE